MSSLASVLNLIGGGGGKTAPSSGVLDRVPSGPPGGSGGSGSPLGQFGQIAGQMIAPGVNFQGLAKQLGSMFQKSPAIQPSIDTSGLSLPAPSVGPAPAGVGGGEDF